MTLVECIQDKNEALRVRDIAQLLGLSIQQIYKMAAAGQIPSFRVGCSVRFDPGEFATWLRSRYPLKDATQISRSVHHA